jgi:hypothetical protein
MFIRRRLTFNGLHSGISQNTEPVITAAVRTSNPKRTKNCIISEYTVPIMLDAYNLVQIRVRIIQALQSFKSLTVRLIHFRFRRIKLERFNTTQNDWLWPR